MFRKIGLGCLSLVFVLDALTGVASAIPAAPELDPASGAGAIALLVTAGYMLKDRFLAK
jgi:hypothetical protein